jgi:integral membrane protein
MGAMAMGSAEKIDSAPAPAGLAGGLKFYRFSAYVTGILLLLLTIEMIAKYGFGTEVEMFGDRGLVAFVPDGQVEAFNFSQAILIAHGWFYVVYLFASFRVWTMMRWPFWRFLWLASGGLFPFLSFFIEHYATIVIRRRIDESATS